MEHDVIQAVLDIQIKEALSGQVTRLTQSNYNDLCASNAGGYVNADADVNELVVKYKQYCLILSDTSADEEAKILSELHSSKLRAFKEASKEKGEGAGAGGEGGEGGDSEDEKDPIVLVQPVKVKSSDWVGDSVKASFFGTEALYSGQNAEAVKKNVLNGNGALVEVAAKGQNYVAPVVSVSDLFTSLLYDDVPFADAQPLGKHLSDPELQVMEEFVELTLGSTFSIVVSYVVLVVIGSVLPEVYAALVRPGLRGGMTVGQFGGLLGAAALATSFVLLTTMRRAALGLLPF